ncbi:MAG TPA: hypothetical protein VFH89_09585 [Sphingomicrobium sp.]|nr:hypothetical protein [Sphingomicrobium sp.]
MSIRATIARCRRIAMNTADKDVASRLLDLAERMETELQHGSSKARSESGSDPGDVA